MKGLIVLALLFAITAVARVVGIGSYVLPGDEATMALGYTLVASYVAGRYAWAVGLPRITGYLLAGLVLGPQVLGRIRPDLLMLSPRAVGELRLVDDIALGLIAFTAGGELRLEVVRARARSILAVTFFQTVLPFAGVAAVVALAAMAGLLPLPEGAGALLAASLLLGVTAVANSPATAIAVITEYKARGPLTETVLGVTVIKDVVVVSLFALVFAVAKAAVLPDVGFDAAFVRQLAWEVAGSLVVGGALGGLVALYMSRMNGELSLVLVGLAFTAMVVSAEVHLSGLLICMVAGFVVENFSAHGDAFIRAVERYSPPVYVVFFTLAGAGIDLGAVRATGAACLLLVTARLVFIWAGTRWGTVLAGDVPAVRNWAWTGFVGQAGVTLGLAVLIRRRFPGFGEELYALILAVVAINQIIGPVLFRVGLVRAGEVQQEEPA